MDEIINKKELDEIRNYVRFGMGPSIWPYYLRRIYNEDELFKDGEESFQVLHEYDLLFTEGKESYIVVAIMGFEYCLNLGGPFLDGYLAWLSENNNKSPLYLEDDIT
jgi:hypothetical protein